jgi:hypothetical protein
VETFKHHHSFPKGILSASIISDGVSYQEGVDVTKKVLKYQGPNKDFHSSVGSRIGVLDMFPDDDREELNTVYTYLCVTDCHLRVHYLPMTCDDVFKTLTFIRQR